ncbi:sugar ABC transporter ATP-binding protein [Candidatus Poriferisocius sp.]|uniref:sugar ABC transporter ATP-binding protein n=1 Tax=Candidatus Poriferisocius sp. TaxID=3101276 RepID=UPI003B5ABD06
MSDDALLQVRGLSKRFPGVQALDQVDFEVRSGEIHALIGANGAGKSTLIKILAGVEHPDEGRIALGGREVTISDANAARHLGLAFIHQELALVGRMSVAENLLLGHMPSRGGLVQRRQLRTRALEALEDFLPDVDPSVTVGDLPVARQWLVSLARVTLEEARVVFLDEPTAALGAQEVDVLFEVVRSVVAGGSSVVFVSHRLPEVLELCHRASVLRGGRHVGTFDVSEVDRATLVELIAGEALPTSSVSEVADAPGEPVLEVADLTAGPIRDVSFTLRRGEVLGLGGLVGSGRSELLEALFGARPKDHGQIRLEGREVAFSSPADAVRAGVAMLPEDRREMALFPERSLRVNTVMAHLGAFARGLLRIPNIGAERQATEEKIGRLGIVTSGVRQLVSQLSGGNQQKVVVSRWLCGDVKVFLVDEPTKGVDVAGKAEILRQLRLLAAEGVGVIVASSELEEVADVADRVLVLREGRVATTLVAPTTETEILQACFTEHAA